MQRNCYCCGIKKTTNENDYCDSCLKSLSRIFSTNAVAIEDKPVHADHCISCGQWENRRILWTGRTAYFNHPGDGVPICEWCIQEELGKNLR
ncbi:hypothetical protein [Isobaculum melis]|uniref:hypothetical protein n=1 Tax=Isobaculum melis TaxID=142588 RepID=UPI00115FE61E|nr:hypothetical protein [Isobaculum melis]